MAEEKPKERRGKMYNHKRSEARRDSGEKKPTEQKDKGATETAGGAAPHPHVAQRAEMEKRHEKERMDTHGTQRDDHRARAKRHGEELKSGDPKEHRKMHRRHEHETRDMHHRHTQAHMDMNNRQAQEMQALHAQQEAELPEQEGQEMQPGSPPPAGTPAEGAPSPMAAAA